MSGFIERLLAQNSQTGLPDAVQPRPLARFEGSDGAAWIEQPVEAVTPPSAESGQPAPQASQFLPLMTEMPAAQSEIDVEQPTPMRSVEPVFDEAHAPVQPRAAEALAEPEPRLPIIERETYPDITDLPRHPEAEPTVVQITRVERIDRIEQLEPVDQSLISTRPEMPSLDIAESPTVILPQPEQEMPRQIPEKPPMVRVSIGRVEVHASAPTSPARPSAARRAPASPRAVRSLDDYLRSRNEGRR